MPCTATVSNSGSNYTVTLPGVGTLTFSLDAAGNVTDPTVAGTENGFTASTPKADGDGVTATFTNAATDPAKTQQYKVDVDVHPADTASTEPKVTANVRSADDHHCDGDHDGNRDTHDTDSDAASAHTLAQRTSSDGAQHDSWHRDGDRHRDGRRSGRR